MNGLTDSKLPESPSNMEAENLSGVSTWQQEEGNLRSASLLSRHLQRVFTFQLQPVLNLFIVSSPDKSSERPDD